MILKETFENARKAANALNMLEEKTINEVLMALAEQTEEDCQYILKENKRDLDAMDKADPKYDRLMLTEKRIFDIASDIRKVASLPSPLGRILWEDVRPNGMKISKVSVPFGVIGIIYEARPNVTFDVFSLCFKAGSACILKGGKEAQYSNAAIIKVINKVLIKFGISSYSATLLSNEREISTELLTAIGYVDLIIPRGSKNLINYVRDNAKVPVIETGAGICHAYFHTEGDITKGKDIIFNAKTRRVSVCNAIDSVVIDKSRLCDLAELFEPLMDKNVTVYADKLAYSALEGKYPEELLKVADDNSWGTEFLDYKLSVKCVENYTEAVEHIAKFSSKHSEAIITENCEVAERFSKEVDAACVYCNVSTAFTDGGQFGFGAEIGISTQKLHARGPMALNEITSYKYIIRGDGQTRVDGAPQKCCI
ncbi:MAG: glutamate-5-semialdehyde dehydrogenase [Muribaculaceae bacterium]|nr:glutamate-5-semialdehyde dehydrogenase [Muribaculaceae bacterium]